MTTKESWQRKVNRVFSIYPRIGIDDKNLWIPRESEARRFDDIFSRLGGHVCLDGPTGSGKTSFIWTYLENKNIQYAQVQITQRLDWPGFCHLLVDGRKNRERSVSVDAEIGIDKGLPILKSRIGLGSKERDSGTYDYIQKASQTWTEHDVARMLQENNATLLLDDVEMANTDLLSRLADLSRLLSQSYLAENAKIVFVGKDDTYHRLYKQNISLEGRLFQISLGGFKSFGSSVSLIRKGLSLLGLRHPWNSLYQEEKENVGICEKRIWQSADASPKMLNVLGNSIASRSIGQSGVGWRTIVDESEKMLQEEWVRHSSGFPLIIGYLDEHPMAEDIVKFIYDNGIYKIYKVDDLLEHISKRYSLSHEIITSHLDGLCSTGFCIRTGQSGEIFFVKQPTAAHHLGVALLNPDLFKKYSNLTLGKRPYQFYTEIAMSQQGFEFEE